MNIEDIKNTIICGDALTELKKFPDESIDCVITSPPYFNLRNYKVEGQIGLEKTYQEYIKKLIDVFNEIKRILKKEGTCFVNLGDSYNNHNWAGNKLNKFASQTITPKNIVFGRGGDLGLPDKSLMLIPHRFAIAMLDNGWRLRNTLIWIKPNAMPESVQDRWKKAHEYIFFFTKSKKYYFNLDTIRTPHKQVSIQRAQYELGRNAMGLNPSSMGKKYQDNKRYMGMPAKMVKLNPKGAIPPDYLIVNTNCSKNDGSESHYAIYPQELISPLILAGCPKNGIALDPFGGSGTTGVVAKKLGRNYILIDLNPKYCEIARQRIAAQPNPLF